MAAALKLRKPNIDDVADIAMICDLYHKYKLPFENSFDNEDLIGFVDTGQLLAIDDGYGAIVGIYLVCNVETGLSAEFHMLIDPAFVLKAVRSGLVGQCFIETFEFVKTIYTQIPHVCRGLESVLRRLGFVRTHVFNKYKRYGGKAVNLLHFELYKKAYKRRLRKDGSRR